MINKDMKQKNVNNFAFEIKAILGLEVTGPSCQVAKIGLNGPCDQ